MAINKDLPEKVTRELSRSQRDAVISSARYLRIVAAAGAGKTETLTRRIIYLLASGEEPNSIVAFTFTERAALEMKERVYRRVETILGPESCKRLGEMFVGTIHSFSVRLLQDRFGYGNYETLDDNEEMAFMLRHGWGLGLGPKAKLAVSRNYSENCSVFISSANVVNDELLDKGRLTDKSPDFADKFNEYENLLDEHRLLTFGRMISLTVAKLEEDNSPLDTCRHLIVDEYQDINRAQERLIKIIADHASCYIVGDPRQCIYQWRGSDPRCFDRFKTEFKAETIEIMQNRRSIKQVVSVANKISSAFNESDLRSSMTAMRNRDGTCLLVNHGTDEDEAGWVCDQIAKLVNLGVCAYDDIAILLRSVTTSAPKIIAELQKRKIPYLVGGRVGLFRRDEVQAVSMIFAWCGDMSWQHNRFGGWSDNDNLIETASEKWPTKIDERKMNSFKKKLIGGEFHDFTEAYRYLLVLLGFLDWHIGEPDIDVMIANLGRFNTLLTDYEASIRRRGRKADWGTDLKNLAWFMNSYANEAYEEQQADDIRGQTAVQLMTVHQAKGLEWPIVFIPCMISRRFPSSKTGSERTWLLDTGLFDESRYRGTENDERKLFYVAATRARDALCISYFERINNRVSPSQFVKETGLGVSTPGSAPIINAIDKASAGEDEIFTFAATEIIEYLRCPHMYRLANLWGYQPGLAERLGYGKSLHHILSIISNRAKSGDDPLEVLNEIAEDEFHLPFADKVTQKIMKNKAKKALQKYIKEHRNDVVSAKEIEARLEFQLTKTATISGRVDVIISQNGDRELRDYKTAEDERTIEEASLQLQLYVIGLTDMGQNIQRASVANLEEDYIRAVAVDLQNLEKAKQSATSAIEGIIAGKYEGRQCGYCKDCNFEKICHYHNA